MKRIAAGLVLLGMGLSGCHGPAASSTGKASAPMRGYDMVLWYKIPPVERVSSRETLIPILRIGGTYYTVCRGIEIPLKKCPDGLQWALTPSSMSDTVIGFHGPSQPCSIRIVDRQRASFDDHYLPDKMPPIPMTKVDRPSGLPTPTARRPRTLDDFVGFYQPVWFPWVRWEVRQEGGRYWAVEHDADLSQPAVVWKARGTPYGLARLSNELGFTSFPGDPYKLGYNETMKCFELVRMDSGIRMPLAKVSPSPQNDVVLPPLPIGVPAWH